MDQKTEFIINNLNNMYPDAHCELNHETPFQLLIAVVLSAQTTDERVNKVTPSLFAKYGDCYSLANAPLKDVELLIHSIGLYHNKAINIIALANALVKDFNGEVPRTRKALMSLPGVGRKTANVVLSVVYDIPSFAVDTHVSRIAKRLGLAKYNDDVLKIEEKLCRKIPRVYWNKSHHQFIFFGRYFCKAVNPNCKSCPFTDICKKIKYE